MKKRINKKKIMMIAGAVLFILIGAGIASYPYLMKGVFDYRQQDLINAWMLQNAGLAHQDVPERQAGLDIAMDGGVMLDIESLDEYLFDEDIDPFFDVERALRYMTATLRIPDLNITSPILFGDTRENLNVGVCEVPGSTAAPGETGNYVLAGHYSRIRGRHLNRLPDIQIGASVFITTMNGIFEYEVIEIRQVKAEDTWAVPLNVTERIATLITCDYSRGEPYGRWIVKCSLKAAF